MKTKTKVKTSEKALWPWDGGPRASGGYAEQSLGDDIKVTVTAPDQERAAHWMSHVLTCLYVSKIEDDEEDENEDEAGSA